MGKIKFELVNKIDHLKRDWNELISRMTEPEIFYMYEWINNYIKYNNPPINPCIVVGKEEIGSVICIFPFNYSNRTLNFITEEDTDYNSIFIDPSYNRYYVANKAIEFLLENIEVTDVRLVNMKGNSELFLLQDILKNHGFSTLLKEGVIAPYLLPDTLFSKLQKKELKNIERCERNLKSEYKVTFEEEHKLDKNTIDFIKYHRGKKYGDNSMEREQKISFYTHLASEIEEKIVVNKLCIDGELAAVHFGFRMMGKFYYYIPTINNEYSKYGVGLVLLKHIIEENSGLTVDFLRGNESYKFYWCDNANMTFTLLSYKKNRNGAIPLLFEKLKSNIQIRKVLGK